MDIWTINKYSSFYESINSDCGLRCRYQVGINYDLKMIITTFITWIRERFVFPIRVNVYFKATPYIIAQDGEKVNGTFWGPSDYTIKPFIKVSCGNENNTDSKSKLYSVLSVLETLAHEITHYYQWVNRLIKSERQIEYQAVWYSHRIVEEYIDDLANNDVLNDYPDDPAFNQLTELLISWRNNPEDSKTGDG